MTCYIMWIDTVPTVNLYENENQETLKKTVNCKHVRYRDRPLEKLWGGGGDLRAAGIFFRYQIPCMNFFLGQGMNIF